MNLGVRPRHRSAALFELSGSRRNYRNWFITTIPTRMHSELHGIVEPEAARAKGPGAPPSLFHRAIASGSISSSRFVVSLVIQVIWGGPAPITNLIDEARVSTCVDQELNTCPAAVVVSIGLRSGGGLVGTILEPLQERPEWQHVAGLPRPGKTKALRKPGRIGRGEQFCTDAVGQQAYVEQRLVACPPALLPVKPITPSFWPQPRTALRLGFFFMLRDSALRRHGLQLANGPPGWATVRPLIYVHDRLVDGSIGSSKRERTIGAVYRRVGFGLTVISRDRAMKPRAPIARSPKSAVT
jgi:hypothetical protein